MSLRRMFAGVLALALLQMTAGAVLVGAEMDEAQEPAGAAADVEGEVLAVTRIQPDTITAFGWDGRSVLVRPLDADGNPFTGSYHDVDNWVWTNVRPEITISNLNWDGSRWVLPDNPDWDVVVARVDSDGNIVPLLDAELQAGPVEPRIDPNPDGDDYYYVVAAGRMQPQLRTVYTTDRARRIARATPRVPSWVVSQPASRMVFLPGQEYLVQRGTVWVRYDSTGKVVARGRPGQSWRALLWPQYPDVVRRAQAQRYTVTEAGRYLVIRDARGRVAAVHDIGGSQVDISATRFERRPYYFTPIGWDFVGPLHEAQTAVTFEVGDNPEE